MRSSYLQQNRADKAKLQFQRSTHLMNQSHLSSDTLIHSSNQQTQQFEYSTLEPETRILVLRNTSEIKTLMQRTCQDIISIGHKLTETKKSLGHGKFINWLKFEFSWSVSTATKFMQVSEQFKFVNFTNLNINASALYLIAAPSTPDEVRSEVLRLASNGENISYTKAKQIIRQSKKKNLCTNFHEPVTLNVSSAKCNSCTANETAKENALIIEQSQDLPPLSAIKKSSEDAMDKSAFASKDFSSLMVYDKEYTIKTSMVNNFTSYSESDAVISEIATKIKNLTPEQLALVIVESAKSGLSSDHLNSIITASDHILKERQISEGTN